MARKDNSLSISTAAKNIWQGWLRIARKLARWQTSALVAVLYFLLLAPLGAIMRLLGWDPLGTRRFSAGRTSNWQKVREGHPDLESLRRQS